MTPDHLHHLLLLVSESLLVATLLLLLLRLRRVLGLLPLAAFVGCLQYLQTILTSTLYVPVPPDLMVSPGSVSLFPATLVAVLAVYLIEGVFAARALIFGVLFANVGLTALSLLTSVQLSVSGATSLLPFSPTLFSVNPRIFLIGTSVLLVDALVLLVVYEVVMSRARWIPIVGRISLALLTVLVFDSLVFPLLALTHHPRLGEIVASHVVGKSVAALVYGTCLYGYLRWFDEAGQPLQDNSRGIWKVFTHSERLARAQRERDAQAAAFERTERAKDELLATVSHELRTPLTSLRGALQLLAVPSLPVPTRDEMLDVATRNSERLGRLINELLDLQRLEAGRETLPLSPRKILVALEDASADLSTYSTDRSVPVIVRCAPAGAELRASIDPDRFHQVLLNLGSNAVKFSPDDSPVELSLDRRGDRVRIEVADRGPGIPEDQRDAIWERFSKVGSRSEKKIGGTGLGLAITRTLVEAMHGTVGVRDRDGGGSIFWVDLPLVENDPPAPSLRDSAS